MSSIRLFLTLTIIAIITLVNFISSLRGYRESMVQAEALFDEELLEYALVISAILPAWEPSTPSALVKLPGLDSDLDNRPDFQSTLVFQVFDEERNLLNRFNTSVSSPVAELEAGYRDVNFEGYRWHAFVYHDRLASRWIITAQRDDIRYALAERVILESVSPIVISIPFVGIIVWFLVGIGLGPISRLAKQIQLKEATDLSPVSTSSTPKELAPLQNSTNELLSRLQSSFEREKRFAADAAHELRTPISILKVQIHNLLAELEAPVTSALQLKLGIDRMGHLVEQILDLNRTSPDLYMAQMEVFDLYELCQDVVSDCYDQFVMKNQVFELLGQQAYINGDKFAITILLKNLLSNASKYTPKTGRIAVKISTSAETVTLVVEDNGPGIPANERPRALERFYRGRGDRYHAADPGCGLGLAIVKHIVDLHRAKIDLTVAATDSGLCVTISFATAK